MKLLLLACLAAAAFAEPESDPYLLYGRGLYSPYTTGLYSPYHARTTAYTYGAYNPIYSRFYKREAEADSESEPESDPYLLYGRGLYSPYTSGLYSPYHARTYGAYNPFYTRYNAYGLYKREADAEPIWPFTPSVYSAYSAYGHHYSPYLHHGYQNYFGTPKTYSNDAVSPFNYAAKGQYAAVTAGSAHFAKRDADAEPYFYSGYPAYTGYSAYAHHSPLTTYNYGLYNRGFYSGFPRYF